VTVKGPFALWSRRGLARNAGLGPIFHQVQEDRDYGEVRLQNLTNYLKSIQK
jgi:hypothetical protein